MRNQILNICRSYFIHCSRLNFPIRGMSNLVNNPPNEIEDKQKELTDLSQFEVVQVLSDYSQRKNICVEGRFSDREGKAVIWLEKTPFTEETVKNISSEKSILKKEFINDIYGSYSCLVDPKFNAIKTTVIYPATEKHIEKFKQKTTHLIEETPHLYNSVTLPHILREQFDISWVFNVLEHKQEHERIVFEDDDAETGFVLLPDLKWNGKQTEDLYLLALVHPRGIKSLRDLRENHLPLLRNILQKGSALIEEKYNLPRDQLRIYIHYQPTFYHLHVHFVYLKFEAPGIFVEKSHLLRTVINNIELRGDYYEQATLSFVVSEGESLCNEFVKRGEIKLKA